MTVDLSDFTLNDGDSWFQEPFSLVDREGLTWNSASNQTWWLALQGKGKFPRWQGEGTELGKMLKFLHTGPEEPKRVVVEHLVEWVNTAAPKKTGALLGVVVTLRHVRKLMEAAPQKTLLIWQARKAVGDARCIGFEAPGWKALLMGHDTTPEGLVAFKRMADPSTKTTPAEEPPEPEAGKSGFDFAMSLGEDG